MAQTNDFSIDANLQGLEFRNQANEKLLALATLNAGNTPPINPQNGMVWLDTSKLEYLLKIRRGNKWVLMCSVGSLDTQEITSPNSLKLGGTPAGDYRKVADSYAKVQIDEKLEEARKALVNSFINKDRFCAYTNAINLPFGDMNTHAYWRSIKPGFYFSNLNNPGYINKPTNLAHFLVLRHPESSDVQVLCFQHPTGSVLRLMANSSYTSGWQSLSKVLGENQTWQDVKNQRQAGITYTNSTGRPIFVAVTYATSTATYSMDIEIDGVKVSAGINTSSVIIPSGSTYKIILNGSARIATWFELR